MIRDLALPLAGDQKLIDVLAEIRRLLLKVAPSVTIYVFRRAGTGTVLFIDRLDGVGYTLRIKPLAVRSPIDPLRSTINGRADPRGFLRLRGKCIEIGWPC